MNRDRLLRNILLPAEHKIIDQIFKNMTYYLRIMTVGVGVFKPHSVCSKLLNDDKQSVTDPGEII